MVIPTVTVAAPWAGAPHSEFWFGALVVEDVEVELMLIAELGLPVEPEAADDDLEEDEPEDDELDCDELEEEPLMEGASEK